jgi:hypothetical protein
MTDIGEFEFRIYDSWDSGIPLTDSMLAVTQSTMALAAVFSLLRDVLEEVMR